MAKTFERVVFEVYGHVQGVFFRVHTEKEANRLGLSGFVLNTAKGTVKGELQGPSPQVQEMLKWLRETGSPNSRVDRVELLETETIPAPTIEGFKVVRGRH